MHTSSTVAIVLSIIAILVGLPGATYYYELTFKEDDSDIALSYIEREDTIVPIIASNKGSRPGVIHGKATLTINYTNAKDQLTHNYFYLAATKNTRENLLIPENTSKQFFYKAAINKGLLNHGLNSSVKGPKDITKITNCTVKIGHQTFSGKQKIKEIIIYERKTKLQGDSWPIAAEWVKENLKGLLECTAKIPEEERQKFEFFSNDGSMIFGPRVDNPER